MAAERNTRDDFFTGSTEKTDKVRRIGHDVTSPTFRASVELRSHGNMSVPAPRVDTNKARSDRWVYKVLHNTILVPITWVVLRNQEKLQVSQTLTLSLLRVINFKFPLQPHQKYNITQYVSKVGRMYFLRSGVKGLKHTKRSLDHGV